jgi:hypothetical protein
MLKYFTYSELVKYQDNQNTAVGQVEPVQENSGRMLKPQLNKLISAAYNKGVALYGYDIEDLDTDSYFLRGRRFQEQLKQRPEVDYYKELIRGTCYNFLFKNKIDYPTWSFSPKLDMIFNGYL